MARIEEQIDVAARPSRAFRLCHDVNRRPAWDERVTRMKLLTHGPIRRGSLVRVDAHPPTGGPVFSWEGEFVGYDYPSHSRLEVLDAAPSSPFARASEDWQFARRGEGTRITLVWDYQPRGILGRIADTLVRRRRTRRALEQSLENLKLALGDGESVT